MPYIKVESKILIPLYIFMEALVKVASVLHTKR